MSKKVKLLVTGKGEGLVQRASVGFGDWKGPRLAAGGASHLVEPELVRVPTKVPHRGKLTTSILSQRAGLQGALLASPSIFCLAVLH